MACVKEESFANPHAIEVVLDRLAADVGRAQAYMPRFVEMMAYNFPKKTHLNGKEGPLHQITLFIF